jgi:transitional endoplasmic reticulum ATPase
MAFYDDQIASLREAVTLTPENLPLRQLLGETLYQAGRFDEAEQELRRALQLGSNSARTRLALAETFSAMNKSGEAIVLVEDILRGPERPARAHLLHARLLLRMGDSQHARDAYRRAVAADPKLADPELLERLGKEEPAEAPEDADEPEPPAYEDESPPERIRLVDQDEPGTREVELERPDISFQDVGGMEQLKEEIRLKIIYPLTHREMFEAYGKKIGGGILLYGPPGCGKTYLSRATAGEVKAFFLAVGIHDVVDMWLGQSEKNLHAIFEQARGHAPCVLFFDEVDALGASRTDMRQSAGRALINQFLSELDGVKGTNEGVLILGATNAPWHLDPAFRRPGRFDRILFVPPPDAPARSSILRILCRGKPQQDIDFDRLGAKSDGFSGADLKAIVDIAVEQKLTDAMKTGKPTAINTRDLLTAAARVKPSTKEWFATARNYALYSNQGGLYDDIIKYLKI